MSGNLRVSPVIIIITVVNLVALFIYFDLAKECKQIIIPL